jgi:uncharacterized protein YlxW (UPF0749 family)
MKVYKRDKRKMKKKKPGPNLKKKKNRLNNEIENLHKLTKKSSIKIK